MSAWLSQQREGALSFRARVGADEVGARTLDGAKLKNVQLSGANLRAGRRRVDMMRELAIVRT